MMLLFLALMIVYIVWYQVKGNELKKTIQPQNSGSIVQIVSKSGNSIPTVSSIINSGKTSLIPTIVNKTGTTISAPKITTETMNKNNTIRLLSGTSIYYGSIAIIEKLGIKYQYALADEQGIWFIYLGTPSYDFTSIARALKGSLYTLTTEQDILQNKLFGNKIVFINLPEYKDKQVLMLIYFNDGIWLVQMEYSLYHKSKAYLKSLFID
ncbi:MAG: hypothetical protein WC010_01675 [Candidatus Absconditabacterales bacterium]